MVGTRCAGHMLAGAQAREVECFPGATGTPRANLLGGTVQSARVQLHLGLWAQWRGWATIRLQLHMHINIRAGNKKIANEHRKKEET